MLLNIKQLDELAKLKIELLDIIFELNNTNSFVNYEIQSRRPSQDKKS
mgnify:CR=1 FL=1